MNKDAGNTMDKGKSPEKGKALRVFARILAGILGGSILTRERVIRSIPYVFYIAILAMFYIANTYYAEKTIMESYRLRKEIKELRYEFVTTRSALMYESKQTQVAGRLEPAGVLESRVPPVKLILPKE